MALNFCNNNSLSAITSIPAAISGSALNLISTQTASSSSTLSFTSGIDSTYKEYIFKFINIHPSADAPLTFNMSIDGGSNYNVTKTTNSFLAYNAESGGTPTVGYEAGRDLAQATGFQDISYDIDNVDDGCTSGFLHLFDPSSTTFVKHFIATANTQFPTAYSGAYYSAGYGNTTSAVDAVQFKLSSGTMDSGVIKLYGVS
jgi:hypothetical protein